MYQSINIILKQDYLQTSVKGVYLLFNFKSFNVDHTEQKNR